MTESRKKKPTVPLCRCSACKHVKKIKKANVEKYPDSRNKKTGEIVQPALCKAGFPQNRYNFHANHRCAGFEAHKRVYKCPYPHCKISFEIRANANKHMKEHGLKCFFLPNGKLAKEQPITLQGTIKELL